MAATTRNGCACRVPISEAAVPAFGRTREVLDWLAARGIDVRSNHRGELSIPVADAQRLWDETAEQAADDVAERERVRAAVHTAGLARDECFQEAYIAARRHPGSRPSEWQAAAFAAVDRFERSLPRDVHALLGPVRNAMPIPS